MKLIHLSDLHLGKRVNGFSMLDDQATILEQILAVIDDEAPDAVLIAGDVYDRTTPPAEAVRLFDDFLVKLSARAVRVIVISGNHDSAERLSFGARLMAGSGVTLAPVYDGTVQPVTLTDAHGEMRIWPLPFLRRAQVQRYFPETEPAIHLDRAFQRKEGVQKDGPVADLPGVRQDLIDEQGTQALTPVGGADIETFQFAALLIQLVQRDAAGGRPIREGYFSPRCSSSRS